MPRHIHTKLLSVTVCATVLCGTVGAGYAQEAQTDEAFVTARSEFEEAWKTAADGNKRQAQLQTNIAQYENSVEKAKLDLEVMAAKRRDIRERIVQQQALIDTLASQQLQVAQARERYIILAEYERKRIVAYVRFAMLQDMVITETGPVAGGSMLRSMLRGSLADSIDVGAGVAAVARAREQLIGQLLRMAQETDAVDARLKIVAKALRTDMQLLETQNKQLADSMQQRTDTIDEGWRAKQLSEQELEHVQEENAEVTAKVMEMQQNLVKINIQLKEQKQRTLQSRIDEFDAKYKEQLAQRTALQKKDADLQRIMDGEQQAWKAMQESRNSDKKQYKKVEDAQRTLKDKRERKDEIDAILAGTAPQPAFTDATIERPDPKALAAESVVLSAAIPQLEEKIGYLKQGYTEDAVDAYFRAKDTASRAKKDREAVASQLTAVASQIAATIAKSSEYSAQLDAVNRDSGLDGLPPIFQWPVHGNITARYYDPDYVAVFGVPHKAIDIAVPQGTPVKSVSEGVVFAVKLGGATGYTYVLIGHRNGYSSVYGHLSQVYVKAGDLVDYSTIIGLSGGLPGTNGAGHMTTGAHLHLELMKDGEHMNPQAVLP